MDDLSPSQLKYDVFLSFSVEAARFGFSSLLRSALKRSKILTFTDDESLYRGQLLSDQVLRAISQSHVAIVVLSESYFSSFRCLEELLTIMESRIYNKALIVLPVFYKIDPSAVRHQKGRVADAFKKLVSRLSDDNKVRRWREASTHITKLPGWVAGDSVNESELVERIVEAVLAILGHKLPSNFDQPVGDIFSPLVGDFQSKVDEIISLSKVGSDDVRFVGIWGMGGVGKTALAQAVYETVRSKFDASYFLSNIREVSARHGLVYLRRMLLLGLGLVEDIDDSFGGASVIRHFFHRKKVLIILDDVSDMSELENLAGGEEWYGPGSKIIITTSDKHLLTVYKQLQIYKVGTLNLDESLKLFCQQAFKKDVPESDYLDLSKEIIRYAHGLPLALKVWGSSLRGRSLYEWEDLLDRCRKRLPRDIADILRISYDGLNYKCKMIFLDIACFFNGRTNSEVTDILSTCDTYSIIGIEILIEKSLLSCTKEGQDMHDGLQKMGSDSFFPIVVYEESLHMHDLLQAMGRDIVYEECPEHAGSRSRLWNIEDIDGVLKEKTGTSQVGSIVVDLRHSFKANWHPECFSKMSNLRLLDLSRVELAHHLNCLPLALKFLRWDCYNFGFLPSIDQLYNLESLQLRSSKIKRLWDGAPVLYMLRTVDLSNSDCLRETPDFSGTPNLEKLFFNYCENLTRVHESVGLLKKLVELSLRYCTNLETLPTWLDMNNLEVFIVGECSKLEKLPAFSQKMRRLYFLDVKNTGITKIPESIINLKNLKYLDLSGCKLKSIPELLPNSIILANKDPFLASLDLQHRIESRVSKHPSVAEDPIHLVIDSKGKEEMPPWFERQEVRHGQDDSGEVVTITADMPGGDLTNYEGIAKKTSFGDLEMVDCGSRLVCKKNLEASDNNEMNRHEAAIAQDSVKSGDETPSNFENLAGDIRSKADRIISLLRMEMNDTCFLRIWGESGIGKTTLARVVYDEIQSKFEATCFLDFVREDSDRFGVVSVQKKLLSELGLGEYDIDDFSEGAEMIRKFLCHKKVLIVLDDVNERSQVKYLAGNKEWFGAGSKMVITTRDVIEFVTLDVQFEEFEVERLHPDESLKLLCQEAFRKYEPGKAYLDLSKEVIEFACGIPLVLKVLGSFLCKKDESEWRNAIEWLRRNSTIDISSKLRMSYDGLEDDECKRIFLDIACFFNMDAKFKVRSILKICGVDSTSGIQVLIEKSMLNLTRSNSDLMQNAKGDHVTLFDRIQKMRRDIFLPTNLYDWFLQEASKEYLYMHDLLQEMGRDIVYQESPTNAGSRSRLWSLKDIDDVLKENKGTRNVQSIVLHTQQSFEADWDPDCFSNMQELVLLDLSNVHLSRDLNSLPGSLKIMRWDYYALESLPPVDQSKELESLQVCNSKIRKLWNGSPELHNLRTVDLSNSDYLMETPDFSGTPNLQKLFLNYCENLIRVHESVGQLKKLVDLSLRYCTNLETLPTCLDMNDLEVLILGECSKLEKLPEFSQNMTRLYFLDVRNTDITEIPVSIIRLTNLKHLDLTYCSRLKSIPELPPNLIMSASDCRLLEPTSALRHLYASCARKGPIHLFYDFQLWTRIPTWFERWEYCWGKDPSSGEFVTITANIPSNVVADSNEQCCWGVAVCVVFQYLSQAWLGFSVVWKFKADNSHTKKTKIHGTPLYFMHDCRVYVGFCPFDALDWSQLPSGQGRQLDLTLHFPKTNIVNDLHDLEIIGCGWRLASKKDFDEWSGISRAPSPPRLGFLNR